MTPPTLPDTPDTPAGTPDRRHNRRTTAIGVAAGLVGGAAIGLLVAMPSFSSAASDATTPPTTAVVTDNSSSGATTTVAPDAPDSTTAPGAPDAPGAPPSAADRQAKAKDRIRTQLQNLVDDGTITAAQADAVAADLATSVVDHFPGGPGGPGGPGSPRWDRRHTGLDGDVLAALLGIDVQTLRYDLRDGKTVAEIATAQGVDPQTVIDSLVADAKAHLDLAVQNGRLTQKEADAKLADATQRITDFVNNGLPARG